MLFGGGTSTGSNNNIDAVVVQDEKNQVMKTNVWMRMVNISFFQTNNSLILISLYQ